MCYGLYAIRHVSRSLVGVSAFAYVGHTGEPVKTSEEIEMPLGKSILE